MRIDVKKLCIISLVLVSVCCKSQTIYNIYNPPQNVPATNVYYKDLNNYFSSVIGTWKWQSGNDSFELTLQKFSKYSYPSSSTCYGDYIFGKYKYIKNSVLVVETTVIQTLPNSSVTMSLETPTRYHIGIYDTLSNKFISGEFMINPNGTATITLENKSGTGGIYDPASPPSPIPYSFPKNMNLIKL